MNVGALLSPQTVVLKDGVTIATIYPVWDGSQVPLELVASLWVEYNAEIDRGRSFPETHKLMLDSFERSWFVGVAGVMVRGGPAASLEDVDFLGGTACLGSFYIESCFPGRSSHICTAKFLVNSRVRAEGVGLRLASCFMDWAPRLGYDYALFNLVYATNVAFCRILKRLNFSLLTRLKGAGILNGYDFPVDALQYGRSLLVDEDAISTTAAHAPLDPQIAPQAVVQQPSSPAPQQDLATPASRTAEPDVGLEPSRADSAGPDVEAATADPDYANIRVYLETGAYPEHATRVEKTRLRSRSRSYYVENHQLMFKRSHTIVVAEPQEQLRIAIAAHRENHNGINHMQKSISAKYHWTGMRETITRAIHQCPDCRAASMLTRHATSAVPAVPQPRDVRAAATAASDAVHEADAVGEQLDKEGLSLNSAVLEPAPLEGLRPPRDPYASSQFRWESVVYLPPEQEDDEYVPETESDFPSAVGGAAEHGDESLQDDDMEFNYAEDEDEDEEYVDEDHEEEESHDDEDDDDAEGDDADGDDDGAS